MVSAITLGNNFFDVNGRKVLGGIGGSGLDTQALITGLVDARGLSVKALQDKVSSNDKKATALADYRNLILKLQASTDQLRNVPGFGKQASNAFSYVTGSMTSNTSVAGDTYLGISVEPGTRQQNFTIDQVVSVAQAKKVRTNDFTVPDADTAVTATVAGANEFQAGSIVVKGQLITLENGDSLNRVASKFNAVSGDTGITANVVKLTDNQFRLVFSATKTGTAADFDLTDPLQVNDPSGVLTHITIVAPPIQAAVNASFMIDGQLITRQSNTVNDAIDGVTFTVKQQTPPATVLTGSIAADTTTAKNAIINFMNAYNDIKIFQAKQTEIDETGSYTADAVLANNSTLRSTIAQMNTELTRIVSGLSGTVTRLADVGITFTDLQKTDTNPYTRNVLTVDEAKLTNLLSSDFDKVRKAFEFTLTSSNPNLAVFSRANTLGASNFTLNIDPATLPAPTFTATYNLGSGPQTVNLTVSAYGSGTGYRLEGQKGTALEGLILLYSSGAAATINVTATQGIGDRLYNLSTDLLAATNGAVTAEENALKSNTDKLNEDITRMNTQLDKYREQLVDQFSRLEQALSKVNTILQSISANDTSRNNAANG